MADAEFRREIGEKIRAFGETLKDKEAVIFSERLLAEQPLTLQEIGDKYGISRERVRQIEERLKKKSARLSGGRDQGPAATCSDSICD